MRNGYRNSLLKFWKEEKGDSGAVSNIVTIAVGVLIIIAILALAKIIMDFVRKKEKEVENGEVRAAPSQVYEITHF